MAAISYESDPYSGNLDRHAMDCYDAEIELMREHEFPMLKGSETRAHNSTKKLLISPDTTYLDHAGTTIYPRSLIDAFSKDMMSNLFGNPHSASSSSQLSTTRIDDIRVRILHFFRADPDLFELVFVANATAGIKLVMEGFREQEHGFWYGYHSDSHTSLVGVREAAKAGHHCFGSDEEVEAWIQHHDTMNADSDAPSACLFAYPAQSNMNGRRLPLRWAHELRSSKTRKDTYSLLDAAALVSTSPLDLSNASEAADFTVLSFYKIFGFPDLGALIVRKDSASILKKRRYFGGGTVEIVTCGKENWHIPKHGSLHEELEDGTLPVHSIITLDSALNVHQKLFGSLERIASHTAFLAEQLYNKLRALRHHNGREVCTIYKDPLSRYGDCRTQGPVIAFNLQNSRGDWVSNTEIEKIANIRSIQFRSGGLCNPGGIASSLNLEPWEMKRNFSAGHRCGNENDIIAGKPTGVLRVSFGAMSGMQDVTRFIDFVEEFFIEQDVIPPEPSASGQLSKDLFVEKLTIYPIKSCGGWPVPPDTLWDIRPEGLAWDREWCLVHQGTRTALSQKKYPKMALVRPMLDLDRGVLRVRYHGPIPPSVPNEISVPLSADPAVFQRSQAGHTSFCSQVCGDSIVAQTYASQHIAAFFTNIIGTPCTLARFSATSAALSTRHSKAHLNLDKLSTTSIKQRPILLSNESPILTISRSSLNRLNEQIKLTDGKAAHASVFRANIIVAENPASSPGSERPYAEDDWRYLRINNTVDLDILGGCRRCQMVCVDQGTAEKNEEPFVTLAKTRRREGKVFFGVHTALVAEETMGKVIARIAVGDQVVATTTA